MKTLAFAASNSSKSINAKLIGHAANVLRDEILPGSEVQVVDLNDYEMPIYSTDREAASGIPAQAKELYDAIGSADALLISYAEHNGHYSAAYKNIFDWMSRIDKKVYQGKPMVIMAASPGPGGGASVLKAANDSAPFFGADVRSTLSVNTFGERFNAETHSISDPDLAKDLRQSLAALA